MSEKAYAPRALRTAVGGHVGGGTPPRQVPSYWKGNIPWASVKDFPEKAGVITDTQEHISLAGLNASASNLIPAGTPLVCTRMAVGRAVMPSVAMAINQDVKALFPAAGVSAAYLLKLLQFIQPRAEAQAVGSTVKGIRIQDYLDIAVPLADANAQPVIAVVLNTLDAAIHGTEAIIAKLKAVKQGLLHDLLTRGIDANGELRPPQAEAPHLYKESSLGWIPKAWSVAAVGNLLSEPPRNGLYKPPHLIGRGALLVGQTAFTGDGSVKFEVARRAQVGQSELSVFGLQVGDLLVSRVFATLDGVGQPVVVPDLPEAAVYESNMMRMRPKPGVMTSMMLFNLLKLPSSRASVRSRAFLSNQASINRQGICSVELALPSWEEQLAIDARVNTLTDRLKYEIEALTKFLSEKAGLMDDLLTGRVRVTPSLDEAEQKRECA
jgi:type I restriction enzyme S subunit